ncbi:hypothetical protein AgCh_018690 [Apium graveolens]
MLRGSVKPVAFDIAGEVTRNWQRVRVVAKKVEPEHLTQRNMLRGSVKPVAFDKAPAVEPEHLTPRYMLRGSVKPVAFDTTPASEVTKNWQLVRVAKKGETSGILKYEISF